MRYYLLLLSSLFFLLVACQKEDDGEKLDDLLTEAMSNVSQTGDLSYYTFPESDNYDAMHGLKIEWLRRTHWCHWYQPKLVA